MKSRFFQLLLSFFVGYTALTTHAAAPLDVKGWTFYVKVTEGGHPFSGSGSFFVALETSGTQLRIVNMADVDDNVGNYSYSRPQDAVGEIRMGNIVMTYIFTNGLSGVYGLIKDGAPGHGYQIGTFIAANGNAPTTLTNRVFDFNGVIRDMPGATVKYRLVTTGANTYFRAAGTTSSPTNTFNYNLLNRSTGQIYFKDSVMGEGLDRLVFTSATNGFFAYKIGTGRDYEIGRFVMQALSAPTIVTQPKDQRVIRGGAAMFSVVAGGTAPFQYQWFKGSNAIAGATQQSLRISPVTAASEGLYKVTVKNFAGSITSSNALLKPLCATGFTSSTNYAWFSHEGGNGSVNVTSVVANCSWDVESTNEWITVDSIESPVTFSVAANANAAARTGYILIGNQSFVVAQSGEFAPATLAGKTLTMKINGGEGELPTNATALLAFASGTGTAFGLTSSAVTNAIGGSYTFTRGDAVTGTITLSGTNAVMGTNIVLTFTSARTGTFTASSAIGDQTGEFVLTERMADFNLDGLEDLFLHHTNGLRRIWLMRGTNAQPVAVPNAAYRAHVAAFADFNRDGNVDILYLDQRKLVLTLINPAAGTNNVSVVMLRNGLLLGAGWTIFAAHDLNTDGSADILLQHNDGRVAVWYMNGTNFVNAAVLRNGKAIGLGWRALTMTDINGDAQKDLLFVNPTSGKTAVWYFNAGEFISPEILFNGKAGNPGWRLKAVADVNYDGYHDLLWQHTSGWIAAWHLNGNTYNNTRLLQHSEFLESWRLVGPR